MGRTKKQSRDNVISIRLDDTSIQAIDLLVDSGLAHSRSDGAAQLITLGIRSADQLLEEAKKLANNVQRIKNEMIDAVKTRNEARVRELLQQDNSLINAKNEQGQTAVLLSAYYHAKEITELLLSKGPELDLYEACSVGNTNRVKEILNIEPSMVNVHNHDGYTPLGLAAFFGHADTANELITLGADVNQQSKDGQFDNFPLHAAIAGNHLDVVQILLENEADPNSMSTGALRNGFTAMHLAAGKGKIEVVKLLKSYGGHTHYKNADNMTPYDIAIKNGYNDDSLRTELLLK